MRQRGGGSLAGDKTGGRLCPWELPNRPQESDLVPAAWEHLWIVTGKLTNIPAIPYPMRGQHPDLVEARLRQVQRSTSDGLVPRDSGPAGRALCSSSRHILDCASPPPPTSLRPRSRIVSINVFALA